MQEDQAGFSSWGKTDGLGLAEGGSPWQQPCGSPLLSAGWQWQAGIGAILLAGLVSSAPFQESLIAAGSLWPPSCRARVLAVTCSSPLPSPGKDDADPSAHWALLHGGLLPLWGGTGPSPLLPAPLCPPAEPRDSASCCLSAVLRHLAGAKPPFVAGWLGGVLVGAKLSEGDKKQLGGYFKQNIHCISKSVEPNAKTNLQWVYSPVLCFQPFSSSFSGSEEAMLAARAFVASDTAFGQWSKTV